MKCSALGLSPYLCGLPSQEASNAQEFCFSDFFLGGLHVSVFPVYRMVIIISVPPTSLRCHEDLMRSLNVQMPQVATSISALVCLGSGRETFPYRSPCVLSTCGRHHQSILALFSASTCLSSTSPAQLWSLFQHNTPCSLCY